MLKVSRGDVGLRSPTEGPMSAQRRRNRRAASASDSLASLVMPHDDNNSVLPSSSSSSAKKKQSKHHNHRVTTPSSLEQISDTAATTPIISAEKKSSSAPTGSNKKTSSSKTKHSGKRSSSSMTTSLSSLTVDAVKQQIGNVSNKNNTSPQNKYHKKKRQMSPRSKSKLDSLVTQQPQVDSDVDQTEKEKSQQQIPPEQKEVEPIVKGSLVIVQPRTWPGMNKLGGVGRITAIHSSTSYDLDSSQQKQQNGQEEGGSTNNVIDASTTVTYDVSYVLGGKDKNIEAEYVSLHDANQEAPRERHQRGASSTVESTKEDRTDIPKKKSTKKRKKAIPTESMEALPAKKKVSPTKRKGTKINTNVRGKQLNQLQKVRDQHNKVAAAAEEEGSTASNLKSPAFSLSSEFSKQDGTLSPLDYLADSYPKIDTPILETYSKKWSNEPQQLNQQQNPDEEDDNEERDDDPSSSVVSTDEDGSGFTPPPRRQKRTSSDRYSIRDRTSDLSPPSENKRLELEYGRLALKKQEIERKMKIYKSDAEKINPWATSTAGKRDVDDSGGPIFPGEREEVARHSHRDVYHGNNYPITRYEGGAPSREDVEFGELVYRRNMTDRRMAELKDGYPKPSKPKKKRRRRVVETITRVIHEESEDDGSSISDRHHLLRGGRHGRDYYDIPDNRHQQSFDRRRRRRSDPSYSEFAHHGRDQDYSHQHSTHRSRDQSVESSKGRYPEQAASSGKRKTRSRPSSMLEELD